MITPAEFNPGILTPEDRELAWSILPLDKRLWKPDLAIMPDGSPYLYRWHLIPQNSRANVYFHIQVASDPERPLHDHPWDNFSVILSGGYDELWDPAPEIPLGEGLPPIIRSFRKGDTIKRKATEAHRLILPEGIPYTMTLFSTGPKYNNWGFWYPDGFRPYEAVTVMDGNVSRHVQPEIVE